MTVDSMYSISVTSKFKLFYDDVEEGEDPNDMLSRLEAEAKLKSKLKCDKVEKKSGKETLKKPDAKENVTHRIEKPADKKGKRLDKKDEKPPRFANRQNRENESGKRDEREGETKENVPIRGRGGYRGGSRGGYRGRGGGFRGGRDGQSQRPNGHGPSDDWNGQGENVSGDGWSVPVIENENDRRNEDRTYRGGRLQGSFGRGGYGGLSVRSGGGFRGGRGGQRGSYRNTGREYERHSGSYKTGVKPIDKRDGAGAHNWGTMKDDLDASGNEISEGPVVEWANKEAVSTIRPPESTEDGVISPAVEDVVDEDNGTTPEVTVPVIMTLDEYRAQQAKKKAELHESLKITDATRKINDGQDAFKNMVRYQKERIIDDDEEEEEEEEEDEDEELHRSKQIVIDVRFSDAPRRGGGRYTSERGSGRGNRGGSDRGRGNSVFRGGRGGSFRGGYERAETRQYSSERPRSQAQIRLNDENDFPSLK